MSEVSGVYAAVLTPRLVDDSVDEEGLATLVRFLAGTGVTSYAVNGATGEYCLTTPEDLRTILAVVHTAGGSETRILCGIGAAGVAGSVRLGAIAEDAGVAGLLLPMPHFFPYEQGDLDLFCRTVAGTTKLPILLYNLPQFTSGLESETVECLITEVPNIIGIKDSSGSLETFRHLTRRGVQACRMVGNDGALAAALAEGVCDGVVSGVACAMPELVVNLYAERSRAGSVEFDDASARLDEFIAQLHGLPTPWGLKFALEARGVIAATFSQPVTDVRRAQGAEVAEWVKKQI